MFHEMRERLCEALAGLSPDDEGEADDIGSQTRVE